MMRSTASKAFIFMIITLSFKLASCSSASPRPIAQPETEPEDVVGVLAPIALRGSRSVPSVPSVPRPSVASFQGFTPIQHGEEASARSILQTPSPRSILRTPSPHRPHRIVSPIAEVLQKYFEGLPLKIFNKVKQDEAKTRIAAHIAELLGLYKNDKLALMAYLEKEYGATPPLALRFSPREQIKTFDESLKESREKQDRMQYLDTQMRIMRTMKEHLRIRQQIGLPVTAEELRQMEEFGIPVEEGSDVVAKPYYGQMTKAEWEDNLNDPVERVDDSNGPDF